MSEIFWHYTTAEAAFSIINSGTLRFSDFRYMNDPTEGYSYSDALKVYFSEEKHQPWVDAFIWAVNNQISERRVFVFSLSRKPNHLNQWVGYGGIALGFEVADNPIGFTFTDCVYLSQDRENHDHDHGADLLEGLGIQDILGFSESDHERPKLRYSSAANAMEESRPGSSRYCRANAEMIDLENKFPEIIGSHKNADHWNYSQIVGAGRHRDYVGAIPSNYGKHWLNVFKYKHPGYEDENEVRLLKHSVVPDSIEYRSRGSGVLPYVNVEFAPLNPRSSLKLVAMNIGPFEHSDILKEQWAEFLASTKEGAYKNIEPECSDTPYVGLQK